MDHEKKTYPEAIAHVASMAGIQIERGETTCRTKQPLTKKKALAPLAPPVSFIPVELFEASLKAYEANNFVKYLIDLFDSEITSKLISCYFIGSTNHQFISKDFPEYLSETGANVFWQIDKKGKIRTGKIMLYNPTTGKRIKEPFNHVNWVHRALRLRDFELKQCFFGEHLLKDEPCKPVAIVESEKTAIIASVYLPQFIWLAVGSLTNLNADKCKNLAGRNITLFPDKGGFDEWTKKAIELNHIVKFRVSDLLEAKNAEPKSDLADYLIKFNYKEFAQPESKSVLFRTVANPKPINLEPLSDVKPFERVNHIYYFSKPDLAQPKSWEQDITELEQYFESISLPTQPVNYKQGETIGNVSLFLETHFATTRDNDGKETFLPFLNRLQILKNLLKNEKD